MLSVNSENWSGLEPLTGFPSDRYESSAGEEAGSPLGGGRGG